MAPVQDPAATGTLGYSGANCTEVTAMNQPVRRLADQTSPYLRQHADNPVDWYPWGPEALEAARTADKPILLSVGYSACHWCHVMEHESFEDPETAALMNERFVCIKVDREERPDVDQIYMDAVVRWHGQGGWPLTAFCTPEGRPFYGGTYYPPEPRHGLPSFRQVLQAMEQIAYVIESCIPMCDRVLDSGEIPDDSEVDQAFGLRERLH